MLKQRGKDDRDSIKGKFPFSYYYKNQCGPFHIELRVWDDRNGDGIPGNTIPVVQCDGSVKQVTDNNNICWLDVLIEDKIRPFCTPPHAVTVDCYYLPYNFDPTDTLQLQELFGDATGVDNCPNVSTMPTSHEPVGGCDRRAGLKPC